MSRQAVQVLEGAFLSVLRISPFAYSAPSRSSLIFVRSDHECLCGVTQENVSTLLRATENSSPVSSIWIRKRLNSDLVKICFSLLLLSCWRYSNPSWFLFCSQEVKGEILNLSHAPAEEILCITSDTKPFIQTICHSHPPKLIVHQLCFWLYLSKESGGCLLSRPGSCPLSVRDVRKRKGKAAGKRCLQTM